MYTQIQNFLVSNKEMGFYQNLYDQSSFLKYNSSIVPLIHFEFKL